MTQSEYEAEVHFRFCKNIFSTLESKGPRESLQERICTDYSVPLRKNITPPSGNWR